MASQTAIGQKFGNQIAGDALGERRAEWIADRRQDDDGVATFGDNGSIDLGVGDCCGIGAQRGIISKPNAPRRCRGECNVDPFSSSGGREGRHGGVAI